MDNDIDIVAYLSDYSPVESSKESSNYSISIDNHI